MVQLNLWVRLRTIKNERKKAGHPCYSQGCPITLRRYAISIDDVLMWRRRWDSNPRALSDNSISSPAPKRISRKRAGQSWSVCPRIFGGVKRFSRGRAPKNGDSTNQIGNARFGPVWQDFLEKCKISCKIIEG